MTFPALLHAGADDQLSDGAVRLLVELVAVLDVMAPRPLPPHLPSGRSSAARDVVSLLDELAVRGYLDARAGRWRLRWALGGDTG